MTRSRTRTAGALALAALLAASAPASAGNKNEDARRLQEASAKADQLERKIATARPQTSLDEINARFAQTQIDSARKLMARRDWKLATLVLKNAETTLSLRRPEVSR